MTRHSAPARHVRLRPATPADIDGILEIEKKSFRREDRFNRRQVRYLANDKRALVLVAEEHGRILGWSAGLLRRQGDRRSGRIYSLAVARDARGLGLGTRLLLRTLHWMEMRRAQRIFLEVSSSNRSAIRLYQKHGFTRVGFLTDYYARGRHGIRMLREI